MQATRMSDTEWTVTEEEEGSAFRFFGRPDMTAADVLAEIGQLGAAPTEAQIKHARIAARMEEARTCLAETDWYAIRQAETGQPMPPTVAARRAAARALLSGA